MKFNDQGNIIQRQNNWVMWIRSECICVVSEVKQWPLSVMVVEAEKGSGSEPEMGKIYNVEINVSGI